ncbi:MAG: VOC family protein [Chloroflexota bacterium]|nr:VOC family protein [Chloroflexota bacterium]
MANPVVHYEIRAKDPDAARDFYAKLFGWTYPPGGEPGYTYIDTGVEGGIPGGIGQAQGGPGHVTFFVGVDDVAAALAKAESLGARIVVPATEVPGVTFGLFADPEGHVIGVSHSE